MDSVDRLVKDITALEEQMEILLWEINDYEVLITIFQDALTWCSGSADFGVGGEAREGWLKRCEPLLKNTKIEGEG